MANSALLAEASWMAFPRSIRSNGFEDANHMRCRQCTHMNNEGANFCGHCGAKLERACPNCQAANPPTNKFCNQCGQSLGLPPTVESYSASPQTYIPPYLADKILTSRSALEGERKQVTV